MDVMKALAVLKDNGVELTAEQESALEEFQSQQMVNEARKVFERKLVNGKDAAKWQGDMFKFADKVSREVKSDTVNRGRGTRTIAMFRVETPQGSLKVELSSESDEE